MPVRVIRGALAELYSVDVLPDLISSVTDAEMSEDSAWLTRSLESMYPVEFFDALRVKFSLNAVQLASGLLRRLRRHPGTSTTS